MPYNRLATLIIKRSGVTFGTSGARGLVAQFTDEVCGAFTAAFLAVLQSDGPVSRVGIGLDRRPSSPRMAAASTAAARAMGIEVVDYGVLPTPALALQAMAEAIPAIMITGSHIPFDRNGIKFYRSDGEISKADEEAILKVEVELPPLGSIERAPESDKARQRYFTRYVEWFAGQPLRGKRIGLYEHSAAGRELSMDILEALGAMVIPLGRSDEFVPVDTEAVGEEDRVRAQEWTRAHKLDALLTTDGDGDRPLMADEHGEWLRGDIVCLLCARAMGIQALAAPVNCNSAIETCGAFASVLRTRIGSPYVLAGMERIAREYVRVAGFEANGGFLLGSNLKAGGRRLAALPTRDALLPALTLLVAAARKDLPLSTFVKDLPDRHTASGRLQNFPAERSRALLAAWQEDLPAMAHALGLAQPITKVDRTDGLRAILANGEIVHLRPSGNAPELRCYAEAKSPGQASQMVEKVLGLLANFNLST